MKKPQVCVAFGTRPEASKMAPVIRAFKHNPDLEPIILVTGQHRKQLDEMLSIFGIEVDADLNVMVAQQRLPELAARIIKAASSYFQSTNPSFVLVHGDTATTLAVAVAAFLEGIPVGHVEAGLRSFDLMQPFPEEGNRRVVSAISSLDLPPTEWARENLVREGKHTNDLVITGNTAVDAVQFALQRARWPTQIPADKSIVTITMHRRENLSVMAKLAGSLARLADEFPSHTFVYPVHLNPLVREAVWPVLANRTNVILRDPFDYLSMMALLGKSDLIITDSGGIQEEGAALGVPVAVLRNLTERPEGVASGVLKLVGNDPELAYQRLYDLLSNKALLQAMRCKPNPYGDGRAGPRIVNAIAWKLGLAERPANWISGSVGSQDVTLNS